MSDGAAAAGDSRRPTTVADAATLFTPAGTFLDTATMGLPPTTAVDALTADLASWQRGEVDARRYDAVVAAARASYARLCGVAVDRVAVGHQVSPLVGLVASSVPDGGRVVVYEGDFASVLFPFLVQARHRGVEVVAVPLDAIAERIDARTDWVAVSAVQSATGAVADLDSIEFAAREHGARTLVDTTQSCGWLPLDAGRFDVTVTGAYKWLLSPRGSAFATISPDLRDVLVPVSAGWYSGDDPWSSIYGLPLRQAPDARRFDVSPAWSAWVGTAISLELIASIGPDVIGAHDRALATAAARRLGVEDPGSAVLSLSVPEGTQERLVAAGIRASVRAGRLRVGFHLYNTLDDVERLVAVL